MTAAVRSRDFSYLLETSRNWVMTFRRRYSRFRPEDPAVTIRSADGPEIRAEVENESYGGMGLLCDDPPNLCEGDLVTIEIEGGEYEAIIVSIRRGEQTHLGVKWIAEDADAEDFSDEEE